jgi:ribosomal protein L24
MQDNFRITKKIIEGKLRKGKEGKAPGIDGIVPKILIENVAIISRSLKLMYQNYWRQGRFQLTGKKLM